MKKMELRVEKEDIIRIGHTVYPEDGMAVFICGGDSANMEYLFLRSILHCFGPEYMITGACDEELGDGIGQCDVAYRTNLPFDMYMKQCNTLDS